MNFTQQQIDLIVGTLLGDGNLSPSVSKPNAKGWRYRVLHKVDHQPYVEHKYEIIKDYCETGPKFSITTDSRNNKKSRKMYFNTLTHPSFLFFANMFYGWDPGVGKAGLWVKKVPVDIERFLTPAAIAYWYMDDGSVKSLGKSNGMRISTQNFTLDDVNRLRAVLLKRHKIDTSKTKRSIQNPVRGSSGSIDRYLIGINENESAAFRDLIRPYLIPCMAYKVTDGQKGHL